MACYSARAGGCTVGRRGRAAACSATTRLATQLLACWTSPWRPHPLYALRREDKAPSGRNILLFPLDLTTDRYQSTPKFTVALASSSLSSCSQLRQELSYRLCPLAQALLACGSNPSHSSPCPTEAPPWVFHRGQTCSEPPHRRSLLREVAVSPWSLCASWSTFYPLVEVGARSGSVTVRRGRE